MLSGAFVSLVDFQGMRYWTLTIAAYNDSRGRRLLSGDSFCVGSFGSAHDHSRGTEALPSLEAQPAGGQAGNYWFVVGQWAFRPLLRGTGAHGHAVHSQLHHVAGSKATV